MSGSFMAALSVELQQELESMGTRVHFPLQHVIFVEQQPVHSVLIIESGHVAVSRAAEDGAEVVLAYRGPGEPLGLESVLSTGTQGARVRTASDVTVLDVPSEKFVHFIEEHDLMPHVLRFFVTRLREADEERSRLARLTVRARFAYFLTQLAAEAGEEVGGRTVIDVTFSQVDLATRVGASRESIVKLLKALRTEGVIETGYRKLVVTDLPRLREMASGQHLAPFE
ncbi:Crp/Fnr family transcriptional regulator [Streptomyces sp. NPDC056161]|uniref:Crp/Fnr family transcriptional regulator n=1 Tax=Streptomyces sp. NPDC056161 TaxID=3345732 RepID=UPI0035DC2978